MFVSQSIKLRFVSATIYIALLDFFILLKKFSRYVFDCLKSPAVCLYCVLMTTFLLFLFLISMVSDSMSLLFVPKSELSLNVREF